MGSRVASIPGGETAKEIPSPIQPQRAAADLQATRSLQEALSKAYGWNHPLRSAEIGLDGIAKTSSSASNSERPQAVEILEKALGKRIVGVAGDEHLP
jgi:hypothetical protein